MFLPSWLIIALIFIAILFFYKKKRNEPPYNKFFNSKGLSKRKLRYFRDNNSPDNRLDSDYYDYLLGKCYKNKIIPFNINKRFPAEEEFVDDLNLCWRLFTFIDDTRYYPHWNEQKARNDSGIIFTSWYSEEIRHSIRSKKCFESKSISFFSDKFEFRENDDIVEYDFRAGGKDYLLILCPPQDKYNKYYPVIIMENKENAPEVFLIVRLYYRKDFVDELCFYKLEEFRYDDWLEVLLNKMFRVRIEEKNFRAQRERCERDRKDDPTGSWHEEPWENYKDYKIYTGMI